MRTDKGKDKNTTGRAFRGLMAGIAAGLLCATINACGGSSGGSSGSSSNSASAAPWTWVGGMTQIQQQVIAGPPGVSSIPFPTAPSQGALGVLAVNQTPPTNGTPFPEARAGAAGWIDSQGNSWIFGGIGFDSAGDAGQLNDLWEYTAASGQWTSRSRTSVADSAGVYGAKGAASASNVPGSREASVSYVDPSGNLWLFGGAGFDSAGNPGLLNDLWKYNTSAGTWTWVAGSNTVDAAGVYGTKGTAAASNTPGSRVGAVGWVDPSGNFWLFGGLGFDSAGNASNINDLWMYSATSGQWTWMGGSDTVDASGVYGTQKQAAASNIPGARTAATVVVANGAAWLISGIGQDSAGNFGFLNDTWSYDLGTGEWTWVAGSNVASAAGVYGKLGVISSKNMPGARAAAVAWNNASGSVFLFGGDGLDSSGTFGSLDDLWRLNTHSGKWVWVGGPNTANASGVYGTQGKPARSNLPGARAGATSLTNAHGDHWILGGAGFDSSGNVGLLADFWNN